MRCIFWMILSLFSSLYGTELKKDDIQTATFGAGCFWEIEEIFRNVRGVEHTLVGYEGGRVKHPTYSQVCYSDTGHTEVVRVSFHPSIVSYAELLDIFWNLHNPCISMPTQYKSVIFYENEEQRIVAMESLKEKAQELDQHILTEILPASEFYAAEECHQKYICKKQSK